jgi:hypothetical protein
MRTARDSSLLHTVLGYVALGAIIVVVAALFVVAMLWMVHHHV